MNLSVIIPTYNEADFIVQTVNELEKRAGNFVLEIIIVDGGSNDATVDKTKLTGAKVLSSPTKGRAAQMNFGAEKAKGEVLYFLHADSLAPANFDRKIFQAVSSGFKAGCFQLDFDEDHYLLNFYGWCTRFDIDAFRFGDQSLFIVRDIFIRLNGYRQDHLVMEDNEIVRRIKDDYEFIILDDAVETSARGYMDVGVIKLQLVFFLIYVLYFLGVKQEVLNDFKNKVLK